MPIAVKFCGADDGTKTQSEAGQYCQQSHEVPHETLNADSMQLTRPLSVYNGCLILLEFAVLNSCD